jgi:hypothetical protein
MKHHPLHAKGIGDKTRVLTRGAPESDKSILRDIVSALDGDMLDGRSHVRDGNLQESFRDLIWRVGLSRRSPYLACKDGEFLFDDFTVQRRISRRPKDARKKFGLQFSKHEVAIRDG